MNIKLFSYKVLQLLTFVSFAIFISACSNNGTKVENETSDTLDAQQSKKDDLNKAKQIFYSLPSPIETAMLMKRAGAKYNQEYLNSISNVSKYSTSKSKALNLGVYGADLSFSSMFDQSQSSLKYLSTSKKLADDLGILNAIDKTIVSRMEKNINNRDSLMAIISETFMNSNSFLKENDRAEVAAIILVGGWVEGLYIATKVAKSTTANKEIIERIIDQRLSLNTLINLLNEYKNDENVASLIPDMNELNTVFSKIKITSSKIEPTTNEKTKVTTLKTNTQTKMSPEVFDELVKKVDLFRNKIIK